jgi:hypothetical protein
MLNRKRKKRDRIPRNSRAVFYCEREVQGVQRFHELRLSADARSVFARWGRVDKPTGVANKKTRYASPEEVTELLFPLTSSSLSPPSHVLLTLSSLSRPHLSPPGGGQ